MSSPPATPGGQVLPSAVGDDDGATHHPIDGTNTALSAGTSPLIQEISQLDDADAAPADTVTRAFISSC